MKYLKKYNESIDFNDIVEEEFDDDNKYEYIPIYKTINGNYKDIDLMRIKDLYYRAENNNHLLKMAGIMANKITHLDKVIRRGNAAKIFNRGKDSYNPYLCEIFYKRAEELYYKYIF